MDTILSQASSLVDNWGKVGTLASLIVLVNILVNATKIDLWGIDEKVPNALRPYIAVVLGMVGAFLTALQAGKPLVQSLFAGLFVGLGAIGLHEVVTNARPSVRAAASAAKPAVMLALVIFGIGAMTQAIVACATIQKCESETNPSTGCKVVNDVVDCSKPELKPVEDAVKPVLVSEVEKAMGMDGTVNWDSPDLLATMEHLAMQYGECVVVDLLGQFMTAKATPGSGPSPTPASVKAGIDKLRAKHGGKHVVYHTSHGDL